MMQEPRLTHPKGMGIVAPVIAPVVTFKRVQRLFSRGALPEVDRSHPSGSLFLARYNRPMTPPRTPAPSAAQAFASNLSRPPASLRNQFRATTLTNVRLCR